MPLTPGTDDVQPVPKGAGAQQAPRYELAAEVLRVSGTLLLRVYGSSMLPSIWPGDILQVHRAEIVDLRPGDITLYSRGGGFVVHRVVENNAAVLIARGDSLAGNDPPVRPQQILGRVAAVQRGRTRFTPKGTLNCFQKLCRFLILRSLWLRMFLLRLNALRLRLNGPRSAPMAASK